MNTTELSNEFDIYWNNIMSNMAPNLDEYEKSVFLTKAQEDLVIKLYSGDGFENTELNRRYLSNLLNNGVINNPTPTSTTFKGILVYDLTLNSDILVLVSELAEIQNSTCCSGTSTKIVNVVPTKYDELNKVIQNPFKKPNNYKALRVDKSINLVHIITSNTNALAKYYYEYIKKPSPIILTDLSATTLSIDGIKAPVQTSVLHPSLHRTLIQYAVQLAKASWESNNKN